MAMAMAASSVNSKQGVVGTSSSVKKVRNNNVLCVAILGFFTIIATVFIAKQLLCFTEINRQLQDGVHILWYWNQLQLLQRSHDHLVGELVVGCLVALVSYLLFGPRRVYLVDFACYKPDRKTAITKQELLSFAASTGQYTNESLEFMRKIQERSGVGDDCFMFERRFPMDMSIRAARIEAAATMFYSLDELFLKTGVNPKEVHILVVNSSLFTPTPSLSAMIVNRYKMRTDIKSVNLGGMGCSAGLIAIDLAKDLLRSHRQASYAVVCSQEVLAQSPYFGNDRTKLVTNCLFKLGGAAVLLSNRRWEGWTRAKYELLHTVRTHTGAGDRSYQCVYEEEDEDGHVGVTLKKELMSVAGDALRTNITTLGPLVLPITEQLHFFISLVCRKMLKMNIKPYVPDFKTAFEHFCIHAGGRAVLDEIEKNLKLSAYHMEPSRMTLYRFGNTSSSSLWYELAYTEAKGRVQRGDRVWQIAFGSGFKCNSAAWKALRTIKPPTLNPWNDVLHQFPLKEIPECKLELPGTC